MRAYVLGRTTVAAASLTFMHNHVVRNVQLVAWCVCVQDPLSNAVARAQGLKEACTNVEVQMLDAGHCPHDEVPQLVNEGLLSFMSKVTSAQKQSSAAYVQEEDAATAA